MQPTTIRLDKDLLKKLKIEAINQEKSLNKLVSEILKQNLNENRKEK